METSPRCASVLGTQTSSRVTTLIAAPGPPPLFESTAVQ